MTEEQSLSQTAEKTTNNAKSERQQPLRPAMALAIHGNEDGKKNDGGVSSPKSGSSKVVSIEEPKDSPLAMQSLDTPPIKQFPAVVGKRLTGRPTPSLHSSSKTSLVSETSFEDLPGAVLGRLGDDTHNKTHHHGHRKTHHQHDKLMTQVSEWLEVQKAKKAARRAKRQKTPAGASAANVSSTSRRDSQDSNLSTTSLDGLQQILEQSMAISSPRQTPTASPKLRPRRPSYVSRKRLTRTASSDTDFFEGDAIVPSCDVVLDNSKILGYTCGAATSDVNIAAPPGRRAEKEAKAWVTFKSEILRLAHTLRLKGWRRVPLDGGANIEVERLSGALTNAVYVVSPPKSTSAQQDSTSKKPPSKLLLRVYGPQVEHLIDREAELGILRRLARKKIGPRLLGTFRNGRFEEYFPSTTLTAADLRVPETSKQIAKRMRELHDGIELLEQERDEGPFVWRNWDKWVERCEHVISFLDAQISNAASDPTASKSELWKQRGLVCGVEWPVFRRMVETYRAWLNEKYGGVGGLREKLVFAHNDTQYGNLLRLRPTTESPLLLPANTHKQLVVIDFEYASANTPGLEFANHFTEWCYNYHDTVKAYSCNTKAFPTPEEQRRFIRAYLNHRPQFVASASSTPRVMPSLGPGGGAGISAFMLDSRNPGGPTGYAEEEEKRVKELERKVDEMMMEARLWRIANSAQWVAWGIVQANVPELDEFDSASSAAASPTSHGDFPPHASPQQEEQGETHTTAEAVAETNTSEGAESPAQEDDEFDYLAYAQERAMFFWGDCVSLGLVGLKDLPENVQKAIKVVGY